MPIKVTDMAEWNLLQRHMATATFVKERLASGPLTAQEIIDGVRLTHEEYVDLVNRVVRDWNTRNRSKE